MLFAAQNGFFPFPKNNVDCHMGKHLLSIVSHAFWMRLVPLLALPEETLMTPPGQCGVRMEEAELWQVFC